MKLNFLAHPSVVLMTVLGLGSAAPAQTIKVGGTGGALQVMTALSEAFRKEQPKVKVEIITGLGSGGGRRALKAGAIDIALTSLAGNSREETEGLMPRLYGRVPFIIAVHKNNPLESVTTREIIEIYGGKKLYWPSGKRIRVILRPLSDSDSELLKDMDPEMTQVLANAHKRGGMTVGVDDRQAAEWIERIEGAIGSSVLSLVVAENLPLKAVAINHVSPSVKTIADGSYRHFKSFYISTRPAASPETRLFVDFVLSSQARPMLESLGHWVP